MIAYRCAADDQTQLCCTIKATNMLMCMYIANVFILGRVWRSTYLPYIISLRVQLGETTVQPCSTHSCLLHCLQDCTCIRCLYQQHA